MNTHPESRNQTLSAFTLVELLVVLAVIAILAALIFPIFVAVQEKGRRTACLSNARQLATASDLYVTDFDETYPPFTWGGAIYPYIRNTGIYLCPDDGGRPYGERHVTLFPVSYGYNVNLLVHVANPRRHSEVTSPAQTTLLFEATGLNVALLDPNEDGLASLMNGQSSGSGDGANCNLDTTVKAAVIALYATGPIDNARPSPYCTGELAIRPGRHQGGANYVAIDGHAVWLRGDRVSAGFNAAEPFADQTPAGCRLPFDVTHPADRPCAAGALNGKHALTFSIR